MNMKTSTMNMIMSATLLGVVACSSAEPPKKQAVRKAPAQQAVAPAADAQPATACVSCGAAGSLANIDTGAGSDPLRQNR